MRAVFVTVSILNNMILRSDGLNDLWESEANWNNINYEEGLEEVVESANEIDEYIPVLYNPSISELTMLENLNALTFHGTLPPIE